MSVTTTSADYHEEQLEVNCFTFSVKHFSPYVGHGSSVLAEIGRGVVKPAGYHSERSHHDGNRVFLGAKGGRCRANLKEPFALAAFLQIPSLACQCFSYIRESTITPKRSRCENLA